MALFQAEQFLGKRIMSGLCSRRLLVSYQAVTPRDGPALDGQVAAFSNHFFSTVTSTLVGGRTNSILVPF